MNELEFIKPQKNPFLPENIDRIEKGRKESLSPSDKIYERIKEINTFIKDKPFAYREIFEEYNIFTIQEKITRLEEMIDNDSTISPVDGNHFFHTLGNFGTGLLTLDRAKKKTASQELQAANQKNIIEVSLHLDKMLRDKKYFRESLETQHGYEGNLH